MKKATIYKFIEENGVYVKTEKTTDISLYWIERILGKVTVKGSKKEFEKIHIKNSYYNVEGIFLVERKLLTRDVVCHFVRSYYNGTRSIQNHPYTKDLFDDELLDDLDIVVLTSKWYYSGDKKLCDLYNTFRKENVTDELKEKIKKDDLEQIAKYNYHRKMAEKPRISWSAV